MVVLKILVITKVITLISNVKHCWLASLPASNYIESVPPGISRYFQKNYSFKNLFGQLTATSQINQLVHVEQN